MKSLELISVVTSAMQGKGMRIEADSTASSTVDCVHPAYEVQYTRLLVLVLVFVPSSMRCIVSCVLSDLYITLCWSASLKRSEKYGCAVLHACTEYIVCAHSTFITALLLH